LVSNLWRLKKKVHPKNSAGKIDCIVKIFTAGRGQRSLCLSTDTKPASSYKSGTTGGIRSLVTGGPGGPMKGASNYDRR